MADLVKQIIDQNGLEPTYAACSAGGDKVVPGEGVFLHVKNTNAATRDVVINDPTSRDPGASTSFNPDVTVTIDATTGDTMIALPSRFADPNDGGKAAITYSAVTGLTIAALQI